MNINIIIINNDDVWLVPCRQIFIIIISNEQSIDRFDSIIHHSIDVCVWVAINREIRRRRLIFTFRKKITFLVLPHKR